LIAQEVRCQDLDRGRGRSGADGADHGGEVCRAAVGQIVTVDGGDDDVLELKSGYGLRDVLRLFRVERLRQTRAHVAESAGARARVPHDHHGRVLLAPALPDVGAARLLADGVQVVLPDDAFRLA